MHDSLISANKKKNKDDKQVIIYKRAKLTWRRLLPMGFCRVVFERKQDAEKIFLRPFCMHGMQNRYDGAMYAAASGQRNHYALSGDIQVGRRNGYVINQCKSFNFSL